MVLDDSDLDGVRYMKKSSSKEYFEVRLDSSGISSLEVLNEEECDVTKNSDEFEDNNFSFDEGCKVAKVFLGKKESNEGEDDESSFLGSL